MHPFNARMISETCGLKETDVKAVFIDLQKEGIIRKKLRILSHTFRITEAGIEEAKNAWFEEQRRKKIAFYVCINKAPVETGAFRFLFSL
jgi:hypothetical protein